MADKKRFTKPIEKKYSVRETLTQERLQEATQTMRQIQTALWETLEDETYEGIERAFDTAISSMMAHIMDIDIMEVVNGKEAGQSAASPILMPGA